MVKQTAIAKMPLARVSRKDSMLLFNQIRNKSITKSKRFLDELIKQKKNIDGKYYPKASQTIIELLDNAEKNAEAKGMDTERLFIKVAKANKIFRFYLPKSRFSHRGKLAKICHLEVEIEER
jgi:large subunit ribosomal protein L22